MGYFRMAPRRASACQTGLDRHFGRYFFNSWAHAWGRLMLFHEQSSGAPLAISQPAHAWISGQLLRAWNRNFAEPLLIAAEQHDIGWMDWETAPSFNAATGRPHLFREIGAA